MEQVNKPSSLVTVLMWLQMSNLIVGMVFIVVVFIVIIIEGKQSVVALLPAVAAVVAYGGLGVFTARSILRGNHWAWWLELLYTVPLVSIAIKTISQFKGFATPINPDSFMENIGVAIDLVWAPLFLVAPLSCVMLAYQWRRREVAFKSSANNEQA